MAKSRTINSTGQAMFVLIGILVLLVYMASYMVAVFYLAMFAYYCVIKRSKSFGIIEKASTPYSEYIQIQNEIQMRLNSYGNYSVTKQGRYDERSFGARKANSVLDQLKENKANTEASFYNTVKPYNNAIFYSFAFAIYGLFFIIYQLNHGLFPLIGGLTSTPLFALASSLLGGYYAEKISGITLSNFRKRVENNSNYFSPATFFFSGLLGVIGLIIALQLAAHTVKYSNENDIYTNTGKKLTSHTSDNTKKASVAIKEIQNHEEELDIKPDQKVSSGQPQEIKDSYSEDKIVKMNPANGFMVSTTHLKQNMDDESNTIMNVEPGVEVKAIGRSSDKKWYLISMKTKAGKKIDGFVPSSNIALFK